MGRLGCCCTKRTKRNWRGSHRPTSYSLFHKSLESRGGRIPLRGDLIEVRSRLSQALALQLPDLLAPTTRVPHQAHVAERVQVLRNRLSRHPGALAEPRNRERSVDREAPEQAESSRVSERGEQHRRTAATRHTAPDS